MAQLTYRQLLGRILELKEARMNDPVIILTSAGELKVAAFHLSEADDTLKTGHGYLVLEE